MDRETDIPAELQLHAITNLNFKVGNRTRMRK